MTTIRITLNHGLREQATHQLRKHGFILTPENTVTVKNSDVQVALFELWCLVATYGIDGFSVNGEDIHGSTDADLLASEQRKWEQV